MCEECSGKAERTHCDGCHFTTWHTCNGRGEIESGSDVLQS
jgi:hypothetical protein